MEIEENMLSKLKFVL